MARDWLRGPGSGVIGRILAGLRRPPPAAAPGDPCEDLLGPITEPHVPDRKGRCTRCGLIVPPRGSRP